MARFNLQQRIASSVFAFSRRQIAFVLSLIQRAEVEPRGFTLIELMVAISIFATVMGVASSMLMTSLRGQRKSITAQNVADNVRFATEMMSKEIRMGKGFTADNNASACGATFCRLQFTSTMPNRYNKPVVFYLEGGQIMFDDDTGDAISPGTITSPQNISINSLEFVVSGNLGNSQPRITIVMRAESIGTTADVRTSLDIQTTISPRSL